MLLALAAQAQGPVLLNTVSTRSNPAAIALKGTAAYVVNRGNNTVQLSIA